MKIGVISDTHGNIDALQKALSYFSDADMILHAGDVLYHPPRLGCSEGYDVPSFAAALNEIESPVIIARGNCDPEVCEELLEMPVQNPYAEVFVDKIRIVMNHGHLLSKDMMISSAKKFGARIFISGHTHIPVLEEIDGVVLMNPGSTSIPKFEIDGKPAPSAGIIEDGCIKIINIDDGNIIFEMAL